MTDTKHQNLKTTESKQHSKYVLMSMQFPLKTEMWKYSAM